MRKKQFYQSQKVHNAEDAMEFLTNILDSSTGYSIIGIEQNGIISLWNEGVKRRYGYEAYELLAKAFFETLHTAQDIREGIPQNPLDKANTKGESVGTIKHICKDSYLLISRDIPKEIRLTQELEETQFYTRSQIGSKIDALVTVGPLGVMSDLNEKMAVLTKNARNELVGSPFR